MPGGAHPAVRVHALLERPVHAVVRAAVLDQGTKSGHRLRQRSANERHVVQTNTTQGEAFSFFARLSHLTIYHASLSRRSRARGGGGGGVSPFLI